MLLLKNIVKDYVAGNQKVHALKGVSLNFRKNEFVSVLGPSGCGKTTLLNIIGGLDHYTSGDLVINGKSTKSYKDRDWDVYRNHRIGFIFQSYNLIPHQTVLQNVELALTIAGYSKAERIKKAKKALDRVGLSDKYNKKPNQLSGGQCQRVAIARALVNDPEILLADEPTGALDTVTSVQIMELIKEISKERLVIMVTHNPELAEKYSTRIVRLLDGELQSDSMPYSEEEEQKEKTQDKRKQIITSQLPKNQAKEKAKMSYFTSFMLSLKNLFSKKGRTILVGIAGSIGIIGISLVLAFSAGIKNYVASMQDDMLSGNPITISEETYDLKSLTKMMDNTHKQEIIKNPNKVYINSMLEYLATTSTNLQSLLIKNDITKEYIDYVKKMPSDCYTDMIFDYGIDYANNIFTEYKDTATSTPYNTSVSSIITKYTAVLQETDFKDAAQFVKQIVPSFEQAPSNEDYIKSQYKVHGKVATEKDEIMLVLDRNEQMLDILLAMLGYYTDEQFINLIYDISDSTMHNPSLDVDCFDYDTLLSHKFTYYSNNQLYSEKSPATALSLKKFTYEHITDKVGLPLKVVGILIPNENISYGCMTSGVYYTKALNEYVLGINEQEKLDDASIIKYFENLTDDESNRITMSYNTLATYTYTFSYLGTDYTKTGVVPLLSTNSLMSGMIGGASDGKALKNAIIRTLGGFSLANHVTVYPVNFDNKNLVTDYLDAWNDDGDVTINGTTISKEDRLSVTYTDTLEVIIGLINQMIDIISYALIAFTSVSLVVSTVMIGIITYVSVVERIKEIGVIRSLGGRKKDVSNLFMAETFILGSLSGLIGVGLTYGISAIVNAVLYSLISINNLAMLPITDAITMVILSIVLTSVSGLIPARSASRKDPVIALRTE